MYRHDPTCGCIIGESSRIETTLPQFTSVLTSLSVSGSILSSSNMDPRATMISSVFLVPLKLPEESMREEHTRRREALG